MLFLKEFKKIDKEAYVKRNKQPYKERFADVMPHYVLLNEEKLVPQIIEQKNYNPEKNEMDVTKSQVIKTKQQIEGLKKMGQPVQIVSEKELAEMKSDANKVATLIAENEKLKKELEKKNKK